MHKLRLRNDRFLCCSDFVALLQHARGQRASARCICIFVSTFRHFDIAGSLVLYRWLLRWNALCVGDSDDGLCMFTRDGTRN